MGTRPASKKILVWAEVAIASLLVFVCLAGARPSGDNKKSWQAGTIIEVKTHKTAPESEQGRKQYDISVKVGKKIYVVLYTPKMEQPDPEFYVGQARTVLIEGDTFTFNDMTGQTHSLPILSRKDAPPEKPKSAE